MGTQDVNEEMHEETIHDAMAIKNNIIVLSIDIYILYI